ncbi:TlpA family protein disulfide reductase [Cohnella rhizosphaerae]|uniref:TlpA family protein disulfide reductase n=1 Tax=Cohnella rhizosphaerae TaxID=1457232 RepID=A0A9X4KYL0_9BACL|nr:TlpA disulfide reductase family protein [Cohnella rhizosphaerae]MDG0813630.1 TlpA family protein disulfide reductase [Cohnella rhizosphaerae]
MKRNVFIVVLFIVAIAGVLVYNLAGNSKDARGSIDGSAVSATGGAPDKIAPTKGSLAPALKLSSLDDSATYEVDPKAPQDKVLIINFWASWCGPCDIEAPDLVKLYEEYKGKIELYGVNATKYDTVRGAKDFVKEKAIPFPVLMDKEGKAGDDYKVFSYPISFIVDRDGIVRQRIEGAKSLKEWRAMIDEAMQGAA